MDEVSRRGRFDGIPGLVWYASIHKVRGEDLKLGDWLDSLDHRGARMIYGLWLGAATTADLYEETLRTAVDIDSGSPKVMTVMFSCGDTEQLRPDVEYDVVDPESQVAPDGSAL